LEVFYNANKTKIQQNFEHTALNITNSGTFDRIPDDDDKRK
jgi:hypothetical protein